MNLYKGYVETDGKRSIEKLKGRTDFKTLEEVLDCDSYAGVLADDTVLIDLDDSDEAEIAMNIVEGLQLDCKVIDTIRGKHFLFRDPKHLITRCRTHVPLACGLTADIKIGSKTSYEVLKVNGNERFCEWDKDETADYQQVPAYFLPVSSHADFLDMTAGDGRNSALYSYILVLTGCGLNKEESRETIRIINKYVLKSPLGDKELETILRDESFQMPGFYDGSKFQFDAFAGYMVRQFNIVMIGEQLHMYHDGVYLPGKIIETQMVKLDPKLRKSQRTEVLEYMELIAPRIEKMAEAKYIAFENGVLDITAGKMQDFSPELVMTNKIPWPYKPDAYNELADHTLNKLACNDPTIRALLEECIGYCFYRRNELGKAFILTGERSNGKSTYLDCIKTILGDDNISALDLSELGERFSTSMMLGKLANVGDDIGDGFLQGQQVSIFKKIVTGDRIKAERKGMEPFEFNPYIKMLFSANDIPRMKDKTGAVMRRLIIIPFNAVFSKRDPDYRPYIKYELEQPEPMEYMVRLGVEGLRRVLENDAFTSSEAAEKEKEEYNIENNPVLGFIQEVGPDDIVNRCTSDVYRRYQVFCVNQALQPVSQTVFSKQVCRAIGFRVKSSRVDKKVVRIFLDGD